MSILINYRMNPTAIMVVISVASKIDEILMCLATNSKLKPLQNFLTS